MRRSIVALLVSLLALALVAGPAWAHNKTFKTRLTGVKSATGHFYDNGKVIGSWTDVHGHVRSANPKCVGGRWVKATLVDVDTGKTKVVQKKRSESDGKFALGGPDYTAQYDKTVVKVFKKVLINSSGHRHVCGALRITVPHVDEG